LISGAALTVALCPCLFLWSAFVRPSPHGFTSQAGYVARKNIYAFFNAIKPLAHFGFHLLELVVYLHAKIVEFNAERVDSL
jgi:hypothetical protein